jgi:release factor glutamine methyltransferase
MKSALVVARANARRNSCSDRLTLLNCDVAQAPLSGFEGFDLVVSNPPYIAFSERGKVSPAVIKFEPSEALFAGDSGLEVIEKVFRKASGLLADRGHLVLEFGEGQAASILKLGRDHGWVRTDLRKDLAGIDRCSVFRRA